MEIHWLLANTEHERTLCAVAAYEGEEAEAGAEGSEMVAMCGGVDECAAVFKEMAPDADAGAASAASGGD